MKLGTILCVFFLALLFGCPDPPAPPYAPLLLAEFHVWHGLSRHAYAPYDSRDPLVMIRQIEKAKALGIGGFVVNWYGPACGAANDDERGFQDAATAELIRLAETYDFKIALLYDEGAIRTAEADPADYQARAVSDLQYAEKYFPSPACLFINGRAALFVFPYDDVDRAIDWGEVRAALGTTVTLIDKDPNPLDPTDHDAQFDGFYAWVTATNGAWDPQGAEWGEAYLDWFYPTMQSVAYKGKVKVGGVWPGFDDTLAPWRDPARVRYMARLNTETYNRTMDLARGNNSPYLMIETWNDFEEGTDVEFGVSMAVDMDDTAAAILIRSSPLRVVWLPDHPRPVLQVYRDGISVPIYDEAQTSGVWLALKSDVKYALKLWADDLPDPILRQVVIRHQDPVPGVTPVIVDP